MSLTIKPDGSTTAFFAADLEWTIQYEAENGLAQFYDLGQDPDVQTDKRMVKLCPCTSCKRPVVVNQYYSASIARCKGCKGAIESAGGAGVGQAAIVQAGRTDPSLARDLAACLVNPVLSEISCLLCGGAMELKSVSHNDNYGPSELIGYDTQGRPQFKQIAPGETVMHQCNHCKATCNWSTTAQQVYRRQNEPRNRDAHEANVWADVNGVREVAPDQPRGAAGRHSRRNRATIVPTTEEADV